MKQFNRKIKYALLIFIILLVAFISFSKTGILFSDSGKDLVTVSTTNQTFDPNNYVASVAKVNKKQEETTTVVETTTTKQVTTTTKVITTTNQVAEFNWDGPVLSKSKGVVIGPSGRETYYNLDMTRVVNAMRNLGFSAEEYPYWVREDGVKMLGQYVMVAANYAIRPKGSIVESSLGYAIVCDTGGFVHNNPTQLDIAVTW